MSVVYILRGTSSDPEVLMHRNGEPGNPFSGNVLPSNNG